MLNILRGIKEVGTGKNALHISKPKLKKQYNNDQWGKIDLLDVSQ